MLATILTIIYSVILVIIIVMVIWNMFKSKDMTDKVIGGLILIILILRLLQIK